MPESKIIQVRLDDNFLKMIEEIKNRFIETDKITLNTTDIIKAALRHHYYIVTGKDPYENNT